MKVEACKICDNNHAYCKFGNNCSTLVEVGGDEPEQKMTMDFSEWLGEVGIDSMQIDEYNGGEKVFDILAPRIAELENKIADIKANCDLAIEGRDIKIKELENQVKDLEWQLQEVAKDNDYYQAENKKLEQQIEKMKRHFNCKHRDSEGYCEVKRTYLIDLSYDGCDKWELED